MMSQKQLYLLMFLLMAIVLFQNRRITVEPGRQKNEMSYDSNGNSINKYASTRDFNTLDDRPNKGKYKIGLALSGGGIKCFCHVGVLKALEDKGIRPDIISGVSSGALVAALYADGYSPDSIVIMFEKLSLAEYFRIGFPNGGLFSLNGFKKLLDTVLTATTFEELSIPLKIIATDLDNGQSVIFETGNLVDAIIASCSVPVLFSPYVIDGINYVDGGIFMNMPASPLRSDCRILIGASVVPLDADLYEKSITQIALRSYKFIFRSKSSKEKGLCDILIEPEKIAEYNSASLNRIKEIFKIGYDETHKVLNTPESIKLFNRFK